MRFYFSVHIICSFNVGLSSKKLKHCRLRSDVSSVIPSYLKLAKITHKCVGKSMFFLKLRMMFWVTPQPILRYVFIDSILMV